MKYIFRFAIALTLALPLLAASAEATEASEAGISPRSHAGYVMSGIGVHGVAATWTTPEVRCGPDPSTVRFAVALADAKTQLMLTLGVDVDCVAGVASYDAWLHSRGNPRSRMGDVAAGDVIQASLGAGEDGFSGTISDVTIGWVVTFDGAAVLHPTEVGVIIGRRFGHGGPLPLADFGTVGFTGVRVDGRQVRRPVERLEMRPRDGSGAMVRVSRLDRPTGSFTATWLR